VACPSPRSRSATVTTKDSGSSFFYGGTANGQVLSDLWRLDRTGGEFGDFGEWVQLHDARGGLTHTRNPLQRPAVLTFESVGRSTVLTPWGVLAFGGYRGGSIDGQSTLEERVWHFDLWSEYWKPLETNDYTPGEPRSQAYRHRGEGIIRGQDFPPLFEDVPAIGRYLGAAAIVGETDGKVVDPTGYGTDMAAWPAIYTFGGYDGVRSHDDLRSLSLNGLAAYYQGSLTFEESRQHLCDWALRSKGTEDEYWQSTCLSSTGASPDTPDTEICTIRTILQRAWCEGDYQSLSFL